MNCGIGNEVATYNTPLFDMDNEHNQILLESAAANDLLEDTDGDPTVYVVDDNDILSLLDQPPSSPRSTTSSTSSTSAKKRKKN